MEFAVKAPYRFRLRSLDGSVVLVTQNPQSSVLCTLDNGKWTKPDSDSGLLHVDIPFPNDIVTMSALLIMHEDFSMLPSLAEHQMNMLINCLDFLCVKDEMTQNLKNLFEHLKKCCECQKMTSSLEVFRICKGCGYYPKYDHHCHNCNRGGDNSAIAVRELCFSCLVAVVHNAKKA